jgi:hypothetical protein
MPDLATQPLLLAGGRGAACWLKCCTALLHAETCLAELGADWRLIFSSIIIGGGQTLNTMQKALSTHHCAGPVAMGLLDTTSGRC